MALTPEVSWWGVSAQARLQSRGAERGCSLDVWTRPDGSFPGSTSEHGDMKASREQGPLILSISVCFGKAGRWGRTAATTGRPPALLTPARCPHTEAEAPGRILPRSPVFETRPWSGAAWRD